MNRLQLQVLSVVAVIAVMISYMIICVLQIQAYPSDWRSFNASSCPEQAWNAVATSGWAFSNQWLSLGGNISKGIYAKCVAYTKMVNSQSNPLGAP